MKKAFEFTKKHCIAGVAETTLKQCYKLMLPRAAKLFPANFTFVTPVDQLPHN